MTTENTVILAILLIILLETSYLLYIMQKRQSRNNKTSVYVDTSVLMDGRILSIAETGFITAELVIPRSVIGELQLLADGSDHNKRARARFGLDIAQKLRECESVTVTLLQDSSVAKEGVDERLLNLAKKNGGMVCTIDYNLNKVAQVEGIGVLNVNELAKNVRLSYLPGEVINIELTQKGQESHQGVGYLKDGTMIVVENASKYVGKKIDVEITRALQTDAGRMMFAKCVASSSVALKSKDSAIGRSQAQKRVVARKAKGTARIKSVSSDKKSSSSAKRSIKPHRQASVKRNVEDDLLSLVENQRD